MVKMWVEPKRVKKGIFVSPGDTKGVFETFARSFSKT